MKVFNMTTEKGRAAVWIGSRKIKMMELPIPKAEENGAAIKSNRGETAGLLNIVILAEFFERLVQKLPRLRGKAGAFTLLTGEGNYLSAR